MTYRFGGEKLLNFALKSQLGKAVERRFTMSIWNKINLTEESDRYNENNKKWLLLIVLTIIMMTLMSCVPDSITTTKDESQNSLVPSLSSNERRQALLDHVLSGGPPPDGIPPIEGGQYESVGDADKWLNDEDQVFLFETENKVYLFPQRILVWHEIVNIKDSEHEFALTYCPLTGSAICYFFPEILDTSFGTSGKLINSNLLMYDRATDAYISQIDGVGLNKDLEGVALSSAPVFWMDWSVAKDNFTDALVLSRETGFIRNYNQDPYGKYSASGPTGYYLNEGTIFELIYKDTNDIFNDKYSVIGIKNGDLRLALDPEIVRTKGLYIFKFGELTVQAIHDKKLDIVRLYYIPGAITIEIRDTQLVGNHGETWDLLGKRITATQDLELPQYFEVMWFAWYAFYPKTEVLR